MMSLAAMGSLGSVTRTAMIALVLSCAASTGALGEDKPASAEKPATAEKLPVAVAADAKKAATAAVNEAIANLTKEAIAHKKDSKSPLRAKSNYFIENKSPDVSAEEILTAMNRSLVSDWASDTYIKWQLLSGIPATVDRKLAPKLLSVYQAAALPGIRPGLENASKRQLDLIAQRAGASGAAKINEALQKEVEAFHAANAPILVYREALYARLPGSGDVILTGLQDGAMRAARGIDAERHMKGVFGQITTWSVNASPQQIHAVAGLLREILNKMAPVTKATAPGFPPTYYISTEYDTKTKKMTWKEGSAGFPNAKTLSNDIQVLDETAASLAAMKKL